MWKVTSPNRKLEIIMNENGGEISLSVTMNGKYILKDSPMGMDTEKGSYSGGLSFIKEDALEIRETFPMFSGGKTRGCGDCNELILTFQAAAGELAVAARAYNGGVAFRYTVKEPGDIAIRREKTAFRFPEGELINTWMQTFNPSYENTYDFQTLPDTAGRAYGMPSLFQLGTEGWLMITEAGVFGDYCGSLLGGYTANGLPILPPVDQVEPIRGKDAISTPWRVLVVSENLAGIWGNDMIEALNPPCEIGDTSWIRPGRAAWPWFTDRPSCASLEDNMRWVDFASMMGFEYVLVDAGWQGRLPVEQLVAYATEKNVGIWLWAHSRQFRDPKAAEGLFSLWSSWGIAGIKIDFFESDRQDMIRTYDLIARLGIRYRLMVNFHGSTKPAGERRRWPHLLTREGVLGAEYFGADWSWSEIHPMGATAEHNCTLPFTRNAAGPMDYTPVHFQKAAKRTTWSHQIALPVVFESGVIHYADSIEALSQSVARPFFEAVPASWDESRLLEGYPGRYCTVARRKGDEWFVGSIGAVFPQTAEIRMDFLGEGVYNVAIWEDGNREDLIKLTNPREIIHRHINATNRDTLRFYIKKNGGCALHITKA